MPTCPSTVKNGVSPVSCVASPSFVSPTTSRICLDTLTHLDSAALTARGPSTEKVKSHIINYKKNTQMIHNYNCSGNVIVIFLLSDRQLSSFFAIDERSLKKTIS